MANTVQVNYLSRDFNSIRTDLINYLKNFYPDQWQDFNLASPGMALLELNAYVGDLLSYIADKKFNELFIDGVTERKAAYRLAKTFGYKVPGVRPSITVVDFTIEVPPTANGPDTSYLPVYRTGLQVKGAGQIFETVNDIDFSSDFSETGVENRIIEPILNGNQDLVRYRIIKREIAKAGITRVYKLEITSSESVPFLEVTLPETNVLEILSVIVKPQLGLTETPTFEEFENANLKYYEVDYLADDKVFIEDDSEGTVNGIKVAKYQEVEKRFTKDFLADGRCKLTFGGGVPDYDAYESFMDAVCNSTSENLNISSVLDNTSLGQRIPINSTLFVKYRVGGGQLSNVGSNTLNQVSNLNAVILGTDATLNQNVISSTRANNPIPGIGGRGLPSVDEIKNFVGANFASQLRCVTVEDYIARCFQIPGKFGSPFRIYGLVNDNKIILYVLSRASNGQLLSTSTNLVKNNLALYLTRYRMINDFVEINDGKVINLQVEADLFIDRNFNTNEVKAKAAQSISDFFDVEKHQMNEEIYISQITDTLREIPGVINVVDVRFFNMKGGGYSETIISQSSGQSIYINDTGGYRIQIEPVDNTIFGTPISMFEIKYPDKDVLIRTASSNFNPNSFVI